MFNKIFFRFLKRHVTLGCCYPIHVFLVFGGLEQCMKFRRFLMCESKRKFSIVRFSIICKCRLLLFGRRRRNQFSIESRYKSFIYTVHPPIRPNCYLSQSYSCNQNTRVSTTTHSSASAQRVIMVRAKTRF